VHVFGKRAIAHSSFDVLSSLLPGTFYDRSWPNWQERPASESSHVLLLLSLYVLARWWRRRLFIRALRMDRITVAALRRAIEEGRNPLILDARPKEIRLRDGMIPGAVPAGPEDLDAIMTASRPDREVVVYCACPNEASAATVARRLKQAGVKTIHPLLGGIDAWIRAGAPLDRSPSPAST
jgi:rhodanese-related sulfurtransferase